MWIWRECGLFGGGNVRMKGDRMLLIGRNVATFLFLFAIGSLFINTLAVISLSNVIVISLVAGGITWMFRVDGKQEDIKMICNIGLVSEFKNCFTETTQARLYGGAWNLVDGLSIRATGKAWIFIDRIARYGLSGKYDVIEEITNATIHELIHLCGYRDEKIACLGEELVK